MSYTKFYEICIYHSYIYMGRDLFLIDLKYAKMFLYCDWTKGNNFVKLFKDGTYLRFRNIYSLI